MHTDEKKRFDRRNVDSNLRKGVVTSKEYESYLSKLPDLRDKVFDPEEERSEEAPVSGSPGSEQGGMPKKKGSSTRERE